MTIVGPLGIVNWKTHAGITSFSPLLPCEKISPVLPDLLMIQEKLEI